jgi:type VI secretion system protein ImpL
VTIKTLLLLLFLYICLVWVGSAYLHPDSEFTNFGLRWTGIGLITLFLYIVGSHLMGWWRRWRATPKQRQKRPPKELPVVHEDDKAIVLAIAEANAALTKAPEYASQRNPIYRLPWRLLIGPEGSGKTSLFVNSGMEAQLLSGLDGRTATQGATQLCNLWLANNTIFAEIGGRAFDGDLGRWTQLLRVIRGTKPIPLWRRLLGQREDTVALRGVVGVCDLREFSAASGDPQRFERSCRHWHDRLMAIGEVFGIRFPVYQVITKCDGIPFFKEFFHQLPESDTQQVLGCTLPFSLASPAEPGQIFAEVESKRLTRAFRGLHQSLGERRLTQLAYEANRALRPAIYEFPREIKRIRASVVQFLVDIFRPDPLRPNPLLRGYYFTAVRDTEVAGSGPMLNPDEHTIASGPSYAADATQMLRLDASIPGIRHGRSTQTQRRWTFVSDIFRRVVLVDRPLQTAPPVDARFELFRRRAFAGVLICCALLTLGFFVSWIGNRSLLKDVERAAVLTPAAKPVTLAQLGELDALRTQVERLRNGAGWWMHLGLYSGKGVFEAARTAYFRRFQHLVLDDLSRVLADQLKALPDAGELNAPYEPAYRILKTRLLVSSGACPAEPPLVAQVLKTTRDKTESNNGPDWQKLSDHQIDFYAKELVYGNPSPVFEDVVALRHGRQYLMSIAGVDRHYNAILTSARQLPKSKGLGELAPNYNQVLKGGDVPAGFSIESFAFVMKESKGKKSGLVGDCVFEDSKQVTQAETDPKNAGDLAPEIQRLYVRDYIAAWREFLNGYSIVPYAGPADAAKKLDILSSNRSPLLALFALTANETNIPHEGLSKKVEDFKEKVGAAVSIGAQTKAPPKPPSSAEEITQFFQPVHEVVPPKSQLLVTEKSSAYMDALARLRSAMQAIANSTDGPTRLAANQAANPIKESALDTVRQLAMRFKLNGLDQEVQRLLREPIEQSAKFIQIDPVPITTNEINDKLRLLCKASASVFEKFPFRRSSPQDATLDELSTLFAPEAGQIWKFQMGSLAALTQLENSQWKLKDPSAKPQITADMLAFLNRAQLVKDGFYPKGATRPQLTYSLRPELDSSFKGSTVEVEVDGQLHEWNTVFQKSFTWPAAPEKKPGAIARVRTGPVAYGFTSHGGVWGIFRMMDDAEPRAPKSPNIEWKYTRLGGQQDPIQPAPVRMSFPEFPSGIDVFHPQFLEGIKCPASAVR